MTAGAQWADEVVAGPGGAMTDEVGVVTGDLTLRTTARPGGGALVEIQYTGAEEWYRLTAGPHRLEGTPHAVHLAALALVRAGYRVQEQSGG
ncbi:hypothetical protein OHS33_33440 [Streptomyces sp. NBC_00536]|uniref:hypothetical protein n=1 Tax=Streptomyces sp. NBC_00536 TaxID=2975769 RepID=UPI002E8175FE|nr:hypothetical protein [Streptomyces sp. NBC_00536]WUC82838.1 hypothetical protein OHS33_33440 [Streptomyces sp. NBC_00536]